LLRKNTVEVRTLLLLSPSHSPVLSMLPQMAIPGIEKVTEELKG
jgi:hypothetical protein